MVSVPVMASATCASRVSVPATASVAVAASDRLGLNVLPGASTVSVAVDVSDRLEMYVSTADTASVAVDVSEMVAVIATTPDSKYQPSEPLLVELAPAYHVVSRLYARTPVTAK